MMFTSLFYAHFIHEGTGFKEKAKHYAFAGTTFAGSAAMLTMGIKCGDLFKDPSEGDNEGLINVNGWEDYMNQLNRQIADLGQAWIVILFSVAIAILMAFAFLILMEY